jgi:large subunit ribosomal protein L6
MSRIGRLPVPIPAKVKIEVRGRIVHVEGPKGQLDFQLPRQTTVAIEPEVLHVNRTGDDGRSKAAHGLTRAVLYNMVQGVTQGFVKKLEIVGVGFKASVQDGKVNMALGYSHPIAYPIPAQIKVTVEDNTKITIEGPSKEVVGRVAAELRGFYPPEPYKGKGVRYAGEHIIRKEGKTVQ